MHSRLLLLPLFAVVLVSQRVVADDEIKWGQPINGLRLGISNPLTGATTDQAIPVPPEQSQPWTPPPTKLAPVVVSAITELFKDGLADPRGCEYREIEIGWNEPHFATIGHERDLMKVHGWVLPETGKQRYAIGWNGVIYQVASVGAPVDLRKEFSATSPGGRFRGNGNGWPMSDSGSLRAESDLPIKTAFLLRLGHADLAEKLWNDGYAGEDDMKVKDPYADMASLWLGRWFNWAMQAYLRGDYASALSICQSLSPVVEKVKATAAARDIANPWPGKMYGENLWQLPLLEAESERRAKEPPYTPVLESGQPASGPERIAALIRDLELVSAHQEMNPGDTEVIEDPIVQALVREGYPAIDPLLKCLVEDNRLTRSRYTSGLWFDGPIIPVYEAAYAALFRILNISFPLFEHESADYREKKEPRDLSLEERKALAAKIDAVWQKNKGMSQAENGYATLQDDTAGAQAWYRAIDSIVQPADGTFTSYRLIMPQGGSYQLHEGKAPFKTLGEAFRNKTNPSVSDLIIKRFKEVLAQSVSDKNISFDPVGKLILALADWDGKAHLDDLREMAQAFHTRFPHEEDAFVSTLQTEARIYRKRLDLGDPRALQEYADWLVAIDPKEWNYFLMVDPFQIMWHYPNDPIIRQAAVKLFATPKSPWVPLTNFEDLGILLTKPLIGVAAFRQEVIRGLGDTTRAGTAKLYNNGNASFLIGRDYQDGRVYQEASLPSPLGDPLAPKAGSVVPFRLCDYYAYELSRLDGFPRIGLYWPQAQRDAAVAACKAVLEQYGDAFQAHPQDPYDDFGYATSLEPIRMAFPKLDHPATPNDVKQGRAIFALSGMTRLCSLPDFPLPAYRPNHKEDAHPASVSYPDGTHKDITDYVTEGRVWQAEEVLEDGKWERYYGFVGRYQLEKVPAAEIRFSYQGADGNVTKEISGTIEGPQDYVHDQPNFSFATHNFAQLGAPLPVKVKVSNGSGLDQAVPSALMLPPDANKALPQGISLSLSYSEKLPPKVWRFSEPPFDYGSWQEVPLRKEVQVETSETPGPTLIPTQDFTVLKIDLRDFFDMSRPGTYRVQALFHVPGQAADKSNEITFSVAAVLQ
jgi:hypothetical protein